MNKYIIEGIGTFFLVLTIALTGNPVAIGAILIAMVYMGGYISGAHYNPAVTLAVLLRGRMNTPVAVRYMASQVIGALAASGLYRLISEKAFTLAPGTEADFFHIVAIEALFTFALASVVLHVATSDRVKGNYYYGIAIGLTVMAAAFAGGAISGGVFNPAVAIGFLLMDYTTLGDSFITLLIYIASHVIGAVLAARMYSFVLHNRFKD